MSILIVVVNVIMIVSVIATVVLLVESHRNGPAPGGGVVVARVHTTKLARWNTQSEWCGIAGCQWWCHVDAMNDTKPPSHHVFGRRRTKIDDG